MITIADRQLLYQAVSDVDTEATEATLKWPRYNSAHEGLGILLEEVHELQHHVFTRQGARDLAAMRKEAIQVAAVALRFAAECCDEEVGRR